MPTKAWPLWLLSAAIPILLPVISFIYYPLLLESGSLPSEADSIGIALFGSVITAVIGTPIVLALAWFCLRQFNPATRFWAWRSDRLVRSAVATLVLGGLAIWTLLSSCIGEGIGLAWYEHLWTAYGFVIALWFALLRAAVIDQCTADEAESNVA